MFCGRVVGHESSQTFQKLFVLFCSSRWRGHHHIPVNHSGWIHGSLLSWRWLWCSNYDDVYDCSKQEIWETCLGHWKVLKQSGRCRIEGYRDKRREWWWEEYHNRIPANDDRVIMTIFLSLVVCYALLASSPASSRDSLLLIFSSISRTALLSSLLSSLLTFIHASSSSAIIIFIRTEAHHIREHHIPRIFSRIILCVFLCLLLSVSSLLLSLLSWFSSWRGVPKIHRSNGGEEEVPKILLSLLFVHWQSRRHWVSGIKRKSGEKSGRNSSSIRRCATR